MLRCSLIGETLLTNDLPQGVRIGAPLEYQHPNGNQNYDEDER